MSEDTYLYLDSNELRSKTIELCYVTLLKLSYRKTGVKTQSFYHNDSYNRRKYFKF